ncbi:hypothetical protein NDU88_007359 [Pleurodeles waltl]|uniref:Uncharacterized protein n=1 Tax=Pleurodeles waltl TaxID=8319 RepID=A0AAV7PR68_PLEWA|nr:hypothetical protein NDU88_007359 [Pleurodeles waltl]
MESRILRMNNKEQLTVSPEEIGSVGQRRLEEKEENKLRRSNEVSHTHGELTSKTGEAAEMLNNAQETEE